MKLRIVRADPAGNITLFVLDPVDRALRPEVAGKIMKLIPADQVGFMTETGMEMAGGEFCGNATRAYAMLKARQQGIRGERELCLNVSGCDGTVRAFVNTDKGSAWAEMPLPRGIDTVTVGDGKYPIVDLDGIVHLVARGVEPDEDFFLTAEERLKKYPRAGAYGVLFLSEDGKRMRPLVKVPALGAPVWEGSCGSGTLACAAAQSMGAEDGEYEYKYIQPAGEVEARLTVRSDRMSAAAIGGKVALDDEISVEI